MVNVFYSTFLNVFFSKFSHVFTLLKNFKKFFSRRVFFTSMAYGVQWHITLTIGHPRKRKYLMVEPSNQYAIANNCCPLADKKEAILVDVKWLFTC